MTPTILAVDDTEDNLFLLEGIFDSLDAHLVTARDAYAALDLIKAQDFSLLILDVMMPGMDGYELAEKIRGGERNTKTPIIFCTGIDESKENEFKGYEAGAVDFLYKPLDVSIFIKKVSAFLDIARERNALADENQSLETQNFGLASLSTRDKLTGLLNRHGLDEGLDREFQRAQRYKEPLTVVLLDIDHFKSVNDILGHQYGDYVLSEMGNLLSLFSRKVDVIGRYGGEEFLMVLPNTSLENSLIVVKNLLKAVADFHFEFEGTVREITISLGVASRAGEEASAHDLVGWADEALYQAKEGGRNRYQVYVADIKSQEQFGPEALAMFKEKCEAMARQMRFMYIKSVNALLGSIEGNDQVTRRRTKHVAEFAKSIAQEMKLDEDRVDNIYCAALLQDIGEVGLSPDVLFKEGRFSDEDHKAMQGHPSMGVEVLGGVMFLDNELDLVKYHHERWDGTGYPDGLKGRKIPKGARILSAADAFVAMGLPGEHRALRTEPMILKELQACSGTQFDPDVIEAVTKIVQRRNEGGDEPLDDVKHILVADDEQVLASLVERFLRGKGYRVTKALNGMEAIRAISTTKFDFLLLDINMPGLNGLEVLDKVRGEDDLADVPVGVVTGFCDEALQEQLRSKGLVDVLTKPASLNDIYQMISRALGEVQAAKTPV